MRENALGVIGYYPEDNLSPFLLRGWRKWRDFLFEDITKFEKDKSYSRKYDMYNVINLTMPIYIMEEKMARGKSKGHVGGNRSESNKPVTFQWVNVTLTPEDSAIISGDTSTLEFALSAFVGMVERGVSVSLKHNMERKEWTASIYQPDTNDNSILRGVSGFSADVRLAITVVMYKYNHILSGEFPSSGDGSEAAQQFR